MLGRSITTFFLSTDIDECEDANGDCEHLCTNTFGSFRCSCDEGFRLMEDMSTCQGMKDRHTGLKTKKKSDLILYLIFFVSIALSCIPTLEDPLNGNIVCDKQTVGGRCNFTCDTTYTLRGSSSRSCPPSLQWTGRPSVCDPPMCPELSPPVNGFVVLPCTREEGHLCDVVCAHGYNTTDRTQRTCDLHRPTDTLVWTEAPTCIGM